MKHVFIPQGVCSTRMTVETEGSVIRRIDVEDGCHGNLQGVARLAEGREIAEVIGILSGIMCEDKGTSCPDQLARGLKTIQV
ncbi:MAG: TIGR03905 family TSCPD domain-containing protein [Candidatus Adiutrix sp.]|jgi:uncharacterized protein (TIGR03905 family)|nr:TIGR03905 family TSCPD domain-containing protein [Candidatus Adiutrix sp.]